MAKCSQQIELDGISAGKNEENCKRMRTGRGKRALSTQLLSSRTHPKIEFELNEFQFPKRAKMLFDPTFRRAEQHETSAQQQQKPASLSCTYHFSIVVYSGRAYTKLWLIGWLQLFSTLGRCPDVFTLVLFRLKSRVWHSLNVYTIDCTACCLLMPSAFLGTFHSIRWLNICFRNGCCAQWPR